MPKSKKNSKSHSALFPYYANKRVYDASENLNHTKQAAKGKRRLYDDSENLNHERQVAKRMLSNVCLNFQPSSAAQKNVSRKKGKHKKTSFIVRRLICIKIFEINF